MLKLIAAVAASFMFCSASAASVDFPRHNYPPPHMSLWLCLHGTPSLGTEVGHEASTWDNADTGRNGHYGGLQMHRDWGYGTPHHASDATMLVQVWAAEYAYKASRYSSSFLIQQWAQTIGPCWRYAER